jgi:glucarate dehydratase
MTRTILELGTDEGLTGLGECGISAAAPLFNGKLGEKLVGLAIEDLAGAARACHMDFRDHGAISDSTYLKAYAAIEMAMLDLQGKMTGLPVFQLLGGPVRPRAEFGAYAYMFHLATAGMAEKQVPDAMAAYATEAIKRTGAKVFEFKVGRFSTQTDIKTIRKVRDAVGGDIVLGVDANQALDLDGARRLMRGIEGVRLDWFEEPVPLLADMTRLHEEFGIAISSHCLDPEKIIFYPAIAGIVGDLQIQGGMRGLMRSAATFRGLGRRFWQRACLELGIAWAAMVHVGIACPDLMRASQSLIDYVEDDLILGPMWLLQQGGVIPPDKPGLGVELDREALARYAELFRKKGDLTYFDEE